MSNRYEFREQNRSQVAGGGALRGRRADRIAATTMAFHEELLRRRSRRQGSECSIDGDYARP